MHINGKVQEVWVMFANSSSQLMMFGAPTTQIAVLRRDCDAKTNTTTIKTTFKEYRLINDHPCRGLVFSGQSEMSIP